MLVNSFQIQLHCERNWCTGKELVQCNCREKRLLFVKRQKLVFEILYFGHGNKTHLLSVINKRVLLENRSKCSPVNFKGISSSFWSKKDFFTKTTSIDASTRCLGAVSTFQTSSPTLRCLAFETTCKASALCSAGIRQGNTSRSSMDTSSVVRMVQSPMPGISLRFIICSRMLPLFVFLLIRKELMRLTISILA